MFLGKRNAWMSSKIKSNGHFLGRHFVKPVFFNKSVSINTQTNVIQEIHVGLVNSSSE